MARLLVAAVVAAVLALIPAPGRPNTESCWSLVYDAIRKSAATPVPDVTSYNERGVFIQDGRVRMQENVDIAYHSNGLAYVRDPAFTVGTTTTLLEPGPPLLGPYGNGRSAWLGTIAGESPYPLVASVRSRPTQPCVNLGLEWYEGAPAYHIVLPEASLNAPTLRAMWLDPDTYDVRKTIVGGAVYVIGDDRPPVYPSFEVELERVDGHTVVRHVTWKYRWRVYQQYSVVFAEYYFRGYTFPQGGKENGPTIAVSPAL